MYIMSDYVTIMSLLYVLCQTIMSLLYVLCHPIMSHYVTIILIIFPIMSDYVRGSHPNYLEPTDTNSRPMLQAMTDKCLGAQATLQNEHASSVYEARSTYSAEKRLLYALCHVLYLLFRMSVQDSAARNLYLRTAGRYTTNL